MKRKPQQGKAASGMSFCLFILGVLLVLMPGTIGAQEDEYILEDTVVTGTKTGETMLQETPISISVFDDERLSDLSAFNLEDISQLMPGLDIRRSVMGLSAYIRGIGSEWPDGPADHNIAFYIDGVYLHQGRGAWTDFLDVERIEVLKGPQGTVYGKDSTGGAVNIITQLPSDEWEFLGSVDVGNYSLRRVDAMISGPLIKDKLNMRLTVSDSQHDGLIDNLTTRDQRDQNYTAFRGSFQIIASDKVEIVIRGDYRENDQAYSDADKLISYGPPTEALRLALGISESALIPEDFHTVNYDIDSWKRDETYGGSGELNIHFSENVQLKYLLGHRYQSFDGVWEDDSSPLPISQRILLGDGAGGDESSAWSHELTLNATWGRLKGLFGAYYFKNESRNIGTNYVLSPPMQITLRKLYFDTENLAAFAQLQYAFTDKWTATAGIRYSKDEKNGDIHVDFSWLPPAPPVPPPPSSIEMTEGEWTEWTPKFGLDYRANDNLFVYASAAKGFKGGQANGQNAYVGLPILIAPETVWTYELGVKSDWLEKRLRINGAIFTSDYEDYQLKKQTLHPVYGMLVNGFNAGGADITGFELEVVGRPTNSLTLNGSLTYLDTEYKDYEQVDRYGVWHDASGRPLTYVPDLAFSLGANYVMPIGNAGFLTFGANLSWRDDVSASAVPDPVMIIDDYTLVNARVRFETEDGRWSLEAYGKNIFEEEYFRTRMAFADRTIGQVGDPMTMGIKATYKY